MEMLSVISLIISSFAVAISVVALRQARKTGSLQQRSEAINHVRTALTDVTMHAHIDSQTVSSIREAYQISKLVFSKKISDTLSKLTGITFQLGHKPFVTDKDLDAEHMLGDELQKVLEEMQSEAALSKW